MRLGAIIFVKDITVLNFHSFRVKRERGHQVGLCVSSLVRVKKAG